MSAEFIARSDQHNQEPAASEAASSSESLRARLTPEDLETLRKADEHSDRRLAMLVFLATLAANFLAVIGSLAEASNLAIPVLNLVDPMPVLHVAGSSTILGSELQLASQWQQEFKDLTVKEVSLPLVEDVERSIRLTVEPVGTLAGIDLALKQQVHVLAASEPIPPSDLLRLASAGITVTCAAPIGYDVIAFVTDVNNQLSRPLKVPEVVGILNGSITNWEQVGGTAAPIRVFAREGSGTTDLVLRAYLGQSEFPGHLIPCASQSECLNTALDTPGSLYWVSTAWLRTQPRSYLHAVGIELSPGVAVDPLGPSFDPSSYPPALVRPLYMYVLSGAQLDPRSAELARQFFYYVRGVQGQQMLEKHFFYSHFDQPHITKPELPPGFGPRPDGPPVVCLPQP